MLGLSPIHIMAVVAVALLVFGRKDKVSSFMGDVGQGIKNLRKGLQEASTEDEVKGEPWKRGDTLEGPK